MGSSSEVSGIIRKLKKFTNDPKAYYILWKYAPHLLPKSGIESFQDLKDAYACFNPVGYTEQFCDSWLDLDEGAQKAVRWLKNMLHQSQMIKLYDSLFKRALEGDDKACKSLLQVSKELFADVDKKKDDLEALLKGFTIPEEENEDEDKEGGD